MAVSLLSLSNVVVDVALALKVCLYLVEDIRVDEVNVLKGGVV